jgi:uncharacterized protein (TIGR03435 family)
MDDIVFRPATAEETTSAASVSRKNGLGMKRSWTVAGIVFTTVSACAQISRPTFEVASVRLNTHCDTGGRSGGMSTPGRIALECADLRDLILTAYGIYGNGANPASGSFRMRVVGGPAWMDSTRYDIVAKPAGNPPRSEMYGPMLQSLLEDRFKLKVHRETKEGPVYLLTLTKNGPKLRATPEGACFAADIDHPRDAEKSSMPACGKVKTSRGGPVVTVDISGATIADLCSQLNLVMDREVIDRTGLAGRFDIHLEVTPADLQPKFVAGRAADQPDQPTADEKDGPSISLALQQQLGLKLETGRGPVPVLVVDHIERPTDN